MKAPSAEARAVAAGAVQVVRLAFWLGVQTGAERAGEGARWLKMFAAARADRAEAAAGRATWMAD